MTHDPFAAAAALEGVPSALAGARDAVDVVLRDRGLRSTTPDVTAEAMLRGAIASAALEGSASTEEELRGGGADAIGSSALRLSVESLALVPVLRTSPLQAVARLHALAVSGHQRPESPGTPRADDGVARRLQELARALLASDRTPALAVAALAHAEVLSLRPFAAGNGLVARALERLVLVQRAVDPRSVLVPEAGHRRLGADYVAALDAYRGGGDAGRREWLLYAARAAAEAAAASPLRDRQDG